MSDERKKRKTMLRGKPDRNNTLMDRIEGLELQQVEGSNAVDTMKKMMKKMDQFQNHVRVTLYTVLRTCLHVHAI